MALALEDRAMADDILIGDTPKAIKRKRRLKDLTSRGRLWKHSTLADIDGILSPDEIAAMTTFTLVRNPWDRMVSYYHWLQVQGFDHPAVKLAQALRFEDFLRHRQTQISMRQNPYGSYMRDVSGTERCAHWLRLEHFDTDAAPLSDQLGFELSLSRANASDRDRDYRGYYSVETRQIVETIAAQDIARFGYEF